MKKIPNWLKLGDEILWMTIKDASIILETLGINDIHINAIPKIALIHYSESLEISIDANKEGMHSVAICLVRQCIEALSIIEVGLQEKTFSEPILESWASGKIKQGEIRKKLESEIWKNYGYGLWSEPWKEFYANFAKAIQPYAHYTTELQGWQLTTLSSDMKLKRHVVSTGFKNYDPVKASRITLFHTLLGWTLAKILLSSPYHKKLSEITESKTNELRIEISKSKLLFPDEQWWAQLSPHMYFKTDNSWRDI